MMYWFGFRQLPDGNVIARGPYRDADIALKEREKAKAKDIEVSCWFVAENEKEAEERARFFLPSRQANP